MSERMPNVPLDLFLSVYIPAALTAISKKNTDAVEEICAAVGVKMATEEGVDWPSDENGTPLPMKEGSFRTRLSGARKFAKEQGQKLPELPAKQKGPRSNTEAAANVLAQLLGSDSDDSEDSEDSENDS